MSQTTPSTTRTQWLVEPIDGVWTIVIRKGPFDFGYATFATQDAAHAALARLDTNERRRLVRFFFGR